MKLFVSIFVAVALASTGCGPKPGGKKNSSIDDLTYIPSNSELVASIDGKAIRATAFYQSFATANAEEMKRLRDDVGKECPGVDLLGQINSLTLGVRFGKKVDSEGNESKVLYGTVVVHGLNQQVVENCIAKESEKFTKQGAMWSSVQDPHVVISFPDPNTLVLVATERTSATAEQVFAEAAAGKASVWSSPAFSELWRKIPAGQAKALVNGNSPFAELLGGMAKTIAMSGSFTDNVTISGEVVTFDAEKAKQLSALAKQLGETLGTPPTVEQNDSAVTMKLVLTPDQFNKIAKQAF